MGLCSAQSLIWPTDASHLITSSFGEYRSGHFHSGIDIKTWGKTGYQIFAVEDGSIIRISVSPYGRGQALYLRLNNGWTAVYAHLSGFTEEIEKLIIKKQLANRTYSVDLIFPEGKYQVKKGDMLGYTGRSGTNIPHLHFELRDEKNTPFNPFLAGYYIEDTQAPVMKFVAISPLKYNSHVNGDFIPGIIPVKWFKKNFYILSDTVFVNGSIGFSVSGYDKADKAYNQFAFYKLLFYIDGEEIFSVQYDSISFKQSRQIYLDRDYSLLRNGFGLYQKLYRSQGSTLDLYKPEGDKAGIIFCSREPLLNNRKIIIKDDGSIVLSPGDHYLLIKAVDFFGNNSFISGILRNCRLETNFSNIALNKFDKKYAYKIFLNNLIFERQVYPEYIRFKLQHSFFQSESLCIKVSLNGLRKFSVPFFNRSAGEFIGQISYNEDFNGMMVTQILLKDDCSHRTIFTDTLKVFSINPLKPGILYSSDDLFRVEFPVNSLFYPLSVFCRKESADITNRIIDGKYIVYPQDIPLKQKVKIVIGILPDAAREAGTGLYLLKDDKPLFLSENNRSSNSVSAWTWSLGAFTVLADTIGPKILSVIPFNGERIFTKVPKIIIEFEDNLSGISGENGIVIKLDNKRKIAEYDPQRSCFYCTIREALALGVHYLEITITDRANNNKRWNGWFYILD